MAANKGRPRTKWTPLVASYPESAINFCSLGAEVLYTRLLAQSDDNSCYYGDAEMVAVTLFEHRLVKGDVTVADIESWIRELIDNKIIIRYSLDGLYRSYIHILNTFRVSRKDISEDIRFPVSDEIKKLLTSSNGNGKDDHINEQAEKVLSYLGEKLGKKYRSSKSSLQYISARLKEGNSVDDLLLVIDHKIAAWYDSLESRAWINPVTLFRPTKFETNLIAAKFWDEGGRPKPNKGKQPYYHGVKGNDDYDSVAKK